jgi:rare lipoprotein A
VTRTYNNLLLTTLLAVGCGVAFSAPSYAANAPEISSSVWEEGNAQCSAVSLSGKEVIAFRGASGSHTAEQRAEDLADKLQKWLEDSKIDFNNIVPAKEGDIASIRCEGATVLKLEGVEGTYSLEQSLKLVNALRTANGAEPLPESFIKIADNGNAVSAANAGGKRFSGPASWYGLKFHGRKCADGTRFDMNKLTAAHRFLPLGTKLLVMNRRTGDSCVVKVNDRGPFVGNRVIDLSRGAARQLNMLSSGVALVDCIVLGNN